MQRKIDAREVGLRGRVHFIRLSARSVACVYAWGKGAPASVAVSRLQRRACGRAVRAPRALIQAERTGGKIQETNRPVQYCVTTAAPALSVLVP